MYEIWFNSVEVWKGTTQYGIYLKVGTSPWIVDNTGCSIYPQIGKSAKKLTMATYRLNISQHAYS